jgi:3-oxoacyl-[acyl-carrier protein] reductase
VDLGCCYVSVARVTQRPAVIVFAGNSGLGLSVVSSLIESNQWTVIATYRKDKTSLLEAFAHHGLNSNPLIHQLELSDSDSVSSFCKSMSEAHDIWGVVNCCGETTAKTLKKLAAEEIFLALAANVMPAVNITKSAMTIFSEKLVQGGRIIHLSSVLVRRPVLGVVPYVMSKAAIEGLVHSSAVELGKSKITINALRLGYFDRGMATRDVPKELLSEVTKQTAVKDLGHPANLFAAISYLLSKDASYQTGSVIDLDGGLV